MKNLAILTTITCLHATTPCIPAYNDENNSPLSHCDSRKSPQKPMSVLGQLSNNSPKRFLYGENAQSDKIEILEDQLSLLERKILSLDHLIGEAVDSINIVDCELGRLSTDPKPEAKVERIQLYTLLQSLKTQDANAQEELTELYNDKKITQLALGNLTENKEEQREYLEGELIIAKNRRITKQKQIEEAQHTKEILRDEHTRTQSTNELDGILVSMRELTIIEFANYKYLSRYNELKRLVQEETIIQNALTDLNNMP